MTEVTDDTAALAPSRPRIKDWRACRSGASITVCGYGRDSATVRVTGVASIAPEGGRIFATTLDGRKFELA